MTLSPETLRVWWTSDPRPSILRMFDLNDLTLFPYHEHCPGYSLFEVVQPYTPNPKAQALEPERLMFAGGWRLGGRGK